MASVALSIVYYVIFALFVSSDTEKKLREENRMYSRDYEKMSWRVRILEETVAGLEVKDEQIYQAVFHTSAPRMPELSTTDFFAQDFAEDVPDTKIFAYISSQVGDLLGKASVIEEKLAGAVAKVQAGKNQACPPLSVPIDGFSSSMTGASVGQKVSPFYKVETSHDGLDIICPAGTTVRATASGTVSKVVRSGQALGNTVTIRHPGGYVTKYAHLNDVKVESGDRVKRGAVLGFVGVSGQAYAPHLHYEVRRDSLLVNPVHYMFADVTPVDYTNMLILSANTKQSMD